MNPEFHEICDLLHESMLCQYNSMLNVLPGDTRSVSCFLCRCCMIWLIIYGMLYDMAWRGYGMPYCMVKEWFMLCQVWYVMVSELHIYLE